MNNKVQVYCIMLTSLTANIGQIFLTILGLSKITSHIGYVHMMLMMMNYITNQ